MAEKRSRCGFMAEFKAQAARRVLDSGEAALGRAGGRAGPEYGPTEPD